MSEEIFWALLEKMSPDEQEKMRFMVSKTNKQTMSETSDLSVSLFLDEEEIKQQGKEIKDINQLESYASENQETDFFYTLQEGHITKIWTIDCITETIDCNTESALFVDFGDKLPNLSHLIQINYKDLPSFTTLSSGEKYTMIYFALNGNVDFVVSNNQLISIIGVSFDYFPDTINECKGLKKIDLEILANEYYLITNQIDHLESLEEFRLYFRSHISFRDGNIGDGRDDEEISLIYCPNLYHIDIKGVDFKFESEFDDPNILTIPPEERIFIRRLYFIHNVNEYKIQDGHIIEISSDDPKPIISLIHEIQKRKILEPKKYLDYDDTVRGDLNSLDLIHSYEEIIKVPFNDPLFLTLPLIERYIIHILFLWQNLRNYSIQNNQIQTITITNLDSDLNLLMNIQDLIKELDQSRFFKEGLILKFPYEILMTEEELLRIIVSDGELPQKREIRIRGKRRSK